jgi:glycerol-3-phosphate dehydrogenase
MVNSEVGVIGAGVVGSAVALALSRGGVAVTLLEAEVAPGLAASGTNSGILHTGFDSVPGDLETELILRSAALRGPVLDALGVPVLRCGGAVRPLDSSQREQVTALADNAARNGVEVMLAADGSLAVPGEAVTDPIAFTRGLADAARRCGAEVRTGFRVAAITRDDEGLRLEAEAGDAVRCTVAVNCAGLHADEVARLAGDDSFEICPRKGEFLVFELPGERLERILLPVPTKGTKGVLVFPTVDGRVIAGPTAIDQSDKDDWSVRPQARDEILPKAAAMLPALEGAEQVRAYAGLRPAGRGVNYVIRPSAACQGLVNVAAIRSTGLSASLGIAERVCEIAAGQLGVAIGKEQPLEPSPSPRAVQPWWNVVAEHRGA